MHFCFHCRVLTFESATSSSYRRNQNQLLRGKCKTFAGMTPRRIVESPRFRYSRLQCVVKDHLVLSNGGVCVRSSSDIFEGTDCRERVPTHIDPPARRGSVKSN